MSATTPREGRVTSAVKLERAALAKLRALLDTYAAAVAAQLLTDAPAPVRSYTAAATFDRWAEDQLPACVVVSPGVIGGSIEQRGGFYSASFGLVVGVAAAVASQSATHDAVRLYAAAVRACLLQGPSLDGLVSELTWIGESYDERPEDDRRSLAAGLVSFEARIDDVIDAYAGPLVGADPPDGDDWPRVQTTDVRLDNLNEEVAQ